MACNQETKVYEVLEGSVTAVTLGVLMALAAGEGVTPTGNDRYGDRGRWSPSAGFRSLQRVESAISPSREPQTGSPIGNPCPYSECLNSRATQHPRDGS